MKSLHAKIHPERSFVVWAVVWLIFNLIQSFYTELSNDEAYYWMYSQLPDFGYFDHPPMIAWMIGAGYFLFENELGVRLLTVILSFASLLLLRKISPKSEPLLLLYMFASLLIFQVYSFVAVPDSPLFFFTILLFYQYQKFLKKSTIISSLLLGLTVALLLYSKYHGILVVLFLLISNIRLFLNPRFYIVLVSAALFYAPHILWQIQNDYPSYTFHVLSKSHDPYKPLDTLTFIAGQLFIFGPLIAFWLFKNSFAYKTTDLFERGLKFVGIGFLLFFLASTVNSHGELNWTATAVIPFLILTHRKLSGKENKVLKVLCGITIVAFLAVRVFVAVEIGGFDVYKKSEFHGGKDWTKSIKEVSQGRPVVFINSYQNASKYAFYSKDVSHSMNNSRYRRNQYDLWPIETDIMGQEVMVITNWREDSFKKIESNRGLISYTIDSNYTSYSKIQFEVEPKVLEMKVGEEIELTLKVKNNYDHDITFDDPSCHMNYELLQNGVLQSTHQIEFLKGRTFPKGESEMQVKVIAPATAGRHYMKFVIYSGWYPPFINSRFVPLGVE